MTSRNQDTFQYSSLDVTRRCVQPIGNLPSPSSTNFETSYQNAYFSQSDAPRACDPAHITKPVRGQRPLTVVDKIMNQSGTTTGDFQSVSKSSYKPREEANQTRFEKKNEPKEVPVEYPITLERTRVRGK